MKDSIILLLAVLILGTIVHGCKDEEGPAPGPEFETKDFKATFTTNTVFLGPDSVLCLPPQNFLNIQEGTGSEAIIGEFTFHVSFCVNPANFEYAIIDGSFIDQNGDLLFIDGHGQVVPSMEPGYEFEFRDPFEFVGGTGRFEGATGSGMTKSFNNSTLNITDHTWEGTITLKK